MPNEIAVIEDRSIAPREQVGGLIRPVAPPGEVLAAQNETRALVAQMLKPERDHGVIPGTDKRVLLKPGAERVCNAFGCFPRYRIVATEVDHDREVAWTKNKKEWFGPKSSRKFKIVSTAGVSQGLYRYVIECELIHRASGVVIGQGIASCSTMESKYIDRPRDAENTIIKMAEKRAFVGATLNTFGISDEFTQDVEDIVYEDATEAIAEDGDPNLTEPATDDQLATLRQLAAHPMVNERERKIAGNVLSAGLTRAAALAGIADLEDRIQKRGGSVDFAVAEEAAQAPLPFDGGRTDDPVSAVVAWAARQSLEGGNATDQQRDEARTLAVELATDPAEREALMAVIDFEDIGKGQLATLIAKLKIASAARATTEAT